jgi:general secretion pathway protein G
MAKKRSEPRRIFFTWETRRARMAFFSRRWLRITITAAFVGWGLWILVGVESRHRATFATRATIASVMQATESFRADHDGRCPLSIGELVSPGNGQEPYLARLPEDGWGRPFRFRCPGRKHPRSCDVVSGGPSGNFDGPDQVE